MPSTRVTRVKTGERDRRRGRFPDNAILSHDLLEGSYLRAGLLGEVELTWPAVTIFRRGSTTGWFRGWSMAPASSRAAPAAPGQVEDF